VESWKIQIQSHQKRELDLFHTNPANQKSSDQVWFKTVSTIQWDLIQFGNDCPATLDCLPALLGKMKMKIQLKTGQSTLKMGQFSQNNAGSLDWTTRTLDCFSAIFGFYRFWSCLICFWAVSYWALHILPCQTAGGRDTWACHCDWCQWWLMPRHEWLMPRHELHTRLIAFFRYKWTIASGAHSTPIIPTARLWPHPSSTQHLYKEIYLLEKQHKPNY